MALASGRSKEGGGSREGGGSGLVSILPQPLRQRAAPANLRRHAAP